jgi:5-methylthioadenosine/S-adenosylhomocysteine deaminase
MSRMSRRTLLRGIVATVAVGALSLGGAERLHQQRLASWTRARRPRLVLIGRVVTFDRGAPVIEHGAVYVSAQGGIEAVQAARDPGPAAYATAARIDTGGVIYPGLIDLHNHPYHDLRSLWTPDRSTPYVSRYEWREAPKFQQDISGSDAPPNAYWSLAWEAALKYVEVKALVAGVTTLQGLGLRIFPNAPKEGVAVRHVEEERKDGHRVAEAYVLKPDVPDPFGVLRTTMAGGTAVIYHLAEGSDPALGREFEELYENDCIGPRFVGIHATALNAEQLRRWGARGGTLVWSPLSNLWMYGQTTDIASARAAGLRICLGPDWSIGGSKNLLDELKVADLWNAQRLGNAFTDRELCEMVTSAAADALALDDRIGRIRPGLRADIVVMAARSGDAYRNLIESRESDVQLVVADGRVSYGTSELLHAAGAANLGPLRVGGADRLISLPDPTIATSEMSWTDIVTSLDRVRTGLQVRGAMPFMSRGEVMPLDTFAPDDMYFRALEAASIPGPLLHGLRAYY